jgi:hypothetical protein
MAFKKRESKSLAKAQKRSDGLLAIDNSGTLDLGNGDTHQAYRIQMKAVSEAAEVHNTNLAVADKSGNVLKAEERKLDRLSSRMLSAVKLKFGPDSNEYEQVGGVRESERKARVRLGLGSKSKKAAPGA